jgi:hypothetical protein
MFSVGSFGKLWIEKKYTGLLKKNVCKLKKKRIMLFFI